MSGITRYTRILALFDRETPEWTIAGLSATLATSASTLYRLVREMVAVGLLENTVESRYRLGPFFIEYYRRIRLNDPLIRSGAVFLGPLVGQISLPCTAILARLYGASVMCVAEHRSPMARFDTSYELGRPMPILRGATSKVVLSTLPPRTARSFLAKDCAVPPALITTLESELAMVRKRGICETHGEVDHGLVGIAVPIRNDQLGINASLSIILERDVLTDAQRPHLFTALSTTAKMIQNFMTETVALPA
jgi:DNA-binding IclR family transcriptional regulator